MRKFGRADEPSVLAANWQRWGQEWSRRLATKPGATFRWRQVDGQPVNRALLPLLRAQTQDHCAYCDNYPISPPSIDTIDHFRPKSKDPLEAYRWENLYYACAYCQRRGDRFDDNLLRPDAPDYTFERYFRYDWTRGTIEVNQQASEADQRRARVTLELFRLNQGHPSLRRRELRRRQQAPTDPLDDFAYRDYVTGGAGTAGSVPPGSDAP